MEMGIYIITFYHGSWNVVLLAVIFLICKVATVTIGVVIEVIFLVVNEASGAASQGTQG